MNAGAYGGEMKDIIKSVKVLDTQGEVRVLPKEELKMGYRTSIVKEKGYTVLSVELELTRGNQEEIRNTMEDWKQKCGSWESFRRYHAVCNCDGNVRSREEYSFENAGGYGIFLCRQSSGSFD